MLDCILEEIHPDPLDPCNIYYRENKYVIDKLELIVNELLSEQELVILSYKENRTHSFKNNKITLNFDIKDCINGQDIDYQNNFESLIHELSHFFYGTEKQIFSTDNWGFENKAVSNYSNIFKTEVPVFVLSYHLLKKFEIPYWGEIAFDDYINDEFDILLNATNCISLIKDKEKAFELFKTMMFEEYQNYNFNYETVKKNFKNKILSLEKKIASN